MPEQKLTLDEHVETEGGSISSAASARKVKGTPGSAVIPPKSTLERCVRGLLPRDPMRLAAIALANGELPYERDIEAIVDALCNDGKLPWRRRVVALWALGHVPLSQWQRDEVVDAAVNVLRKRKWSTNCFTATCAVGCSGNSLFALPIMAYLLVSDGRANAQRAEAARLLARLKVQAAVGDLAQTVFDRNRPGCADVRAAASEALRALLPLVREEHYGALPLNVEPQLCRLLAPSSHGLDALALAALAEIGGSASLTAVRECVARTEGLALHGAATDALKRIEARAQRERDASRLLRPATAPETPETILLRPASGGPAQGSELLVRPVEEAADGEQSTVNSGAD